MKVDNWNRAQVLSVAMILVSLFVMIWFHGNLLLVIFAGLAVWLFFMLWVWSDRKTKWERLQKILDRNNQAFIRTLNHHRHDWMNELQVLFGYVRLKKYDQLVFYVEKIKAKMAQESAVAKLGMASLSLFLLSFRVHCNTINLEIELQEEIDLSLLPLDSKLVSETIQSVINQFRVYAKLSYGEPDHLKITFSVKANSLQLDFDYSGQLAIEDLDSAIQRTFKEAKLNRAVQYDCHFQEQKANMMVNIPFNN